MSESSNKPENSLIPTDESDITSVPSSENRLGVSNAGLPADLFSSIPCTVGYSYIRFEVDGNIRPCCISRYEIGNLADGDWRQSWHSGAWMTFRQKLARIHLDKFHLKDPDWYFCQQCSHVTLNQRNFKALKGEEVI